MIDMSGLLTKQGQLFLLLALGLLFKRKKILDDGFRQGLTELIITLVLPCMLAGTVSLALLGLIYPLPPPNTFPAIAPAVMATLALPYTSALLPPP